MLNRLKSLIKTGVEWLHHDYNVNLGIDNTFRVARFLNTVALGHRRRQYERSYINDLQALLRENDEFDGLPKNIMRDGWAIDRSGSLPFLHEMVEQVLPLVEERGGIPEEGEHKPFFKSFYQEGDLERCPAILDFILSSEVLATVAHQMGCIPVLSRLSPPGVRMMESNEAFNPNPKGTLVDSQFYHLDLHDRPVIYVLVLLTETTLESGPWHFLPASTSNRVRRLLGHGRRGEPYRVTDEKVYSVAAPKEVVVFTGRPGDVLFIESSSCFHYGSRQAVNPRFQMMFAFTTPCRGDLKEWVTYGMRPAAKPGDSRLRRMVLRR
ncbi:MAG: hypothetical protein KC800_19905 [Candidatus Eremiobacteraeota bacterium]|nr:hypothetical protein [Candidatus Eremiobacteraeota bacterium]